MFYCIFNCVKNNLKGVTAIYPYKRRLSLNPIKIFKPILRKLISKCEKIQLQMFSPTKLFMNGLITSEEYNNISKYNIVRLRIYHSSNTPLFVKVIFRMGIRKIHRSLRKQLFGY